MKNKQKLKTRGDILTVRLAELTNLDKSGWSVVDALKQAVYTYNLDHKDPVSMKFILESLGTDDCILVISHLCDLAPDSFRYRLACEILEQLAQELVKTCGSAWAELKKSKPDYLGLFYRMQAVTYPRSNDELTLQPFHKQIQTVLSTEYNEK